MDTRNEVNLKRLFSDKSGLKPTGYRKSIKSGYEDYDDDIDLDDMIEDCMARLHSSNIEEGCERIRNSIENSEVEHWTDAEDCFVDVTQFNNTTGNSTTWSFCIDFGSDIVYMLEPFESKPEGFNSDYNAFSIILTMLKGGYKIQSSKKSIKSEIIGNETSDKFIIVGEDDNRTDVNGHFRRFYWNEDKKRFLISLSDATEYDTKDEAAYELQNHIPNRYNDQFRFFSIERKTSLKPQIYESRKPIELSMK